MRPSILAVTVLVGLNASSVRANEVEKRFPDTIQLPNGFRPEGIERQGHTLFIANFDHGAIFRADARTGQGALLVPASTTRQGIGIHLDRRTNHLFVSGGSTGHAYVYDADDGHDVADITLTSTTAFINDHVITDDAVYFTDSFQPFIYKLSLGKHGRLLPGNPVEAIALTGDFVNTAGQFNANGIVATPDGKLILINSFKGTLELVDPCSGVAAAIDAGTVDLTTGDGLVLDGHTLYVIQNTNKIEVLELKRHFTKARVVDTITDPRFEVLATGVFLGDALYVTNPNFPVEATPTQPFKVVRVEIDE